MTTTMYRGSLILFVTVLGATSVAHAQDGDRDGVVDRSDRCLRTPPGAVVDAAGCAMVCDARLIETDGFARTLLTEIGVNAQGAFGSFGPAPRDYHPRPGGEELSLRLGFVANPERNDWLEHDGDYFLPGTPEEGWGITVGGSSRNNNTAGDQEIFGSVIRAECVPSGLCGPRGGARIVWRGRDGGLAIEQEAIILHEGVFIILHVALTNTTSAPIPDVYYLRNVDPDNNQTLNGSFDTRNTVVSQLPPLGTGIQALVSAVQDVTLDPTMTNDAYLALVSRHPSAVASYGGFSNRSAIDAHTGTAPHVLTEGILEDADEAISIALRFDLAAGETARFTYLYVLGESAVDDALLCAAEDSDFDGITDALDIDDDDDGVPDALEVPGFGGDPGADSDGDGVADWRDPDSVPGGCADVAPPRGVCDAVPAAFDTDGDGVPDHLDLDADGDGITDTLESGGMDADGDGRPDACAGHSALGACESAPGVSLLVTSLIDTDGTGEPDLRDTDSDGDGVSDHDEAFDADGDGSSDTARSGADHDGDGIDDAHDPDCAGAPGSLCGSVGAPVTLPLAAFRDADEDGIGDWLEVCGDAYVTRGEVCDTGALRETCSAACLRAGAQACAADAECDSMICAAAGACASCDDTTSGGVDEGCTADRPLCIGASCEICDDTATGVAIDEGCSTELPECDVVARICGPCTDPLCTPDGGVDGGVDGGTDGGVDAGDDGGVDGGIDGGADGGVMNADAGDVNADAGAPDAGASTGRPIGSGLSCAAGGTGRSGLALAFLCIATALAYRRRRRAPHRALRSTPAR